MIQANELRLGVLVFDGKDVVSVNARMISMVEKREAEFDPIPLTEEWLLKFGFMRTYAERTYKKAFNEYSLHEFYVTLSSPDNILSIGDNYSSAGKKIMVFTHNAVQHVHQLQNLYFALTGQELKQKEG